MNERERDKWICRRCKWEGDVQEIRKEIVFHATQEEPDEWQWHCPDCNDTESLEELYENCAWCTTCENVVVQDEGEQCMECITSHAEMLSDAARGH